MSLLENLSVETVARLVTAPAVSVTPDMALNRVLEVMRDYRVSAVTLEDSGKTVGIFTERDALRAMASGEDGGEPIRRFASPCPLMVTKSEPISQAVSKMSANGYRHLPLADDDGRVVGMVDVMSIISWLVDHFPQAIYNLPPTSETLREREGP
ncbi:CBS domain-containing protein [Thermopirellula anaerolimosa]